MSLKKLIDNKEIFFKKNENVNKEILESLSYKTLLRLDKKSRSTSTPRSTSRSKSKPKTRSIYNKSNIITRLIKQKIKNDDLIKLYYELNPLLNKLPQEINEIIYKKKKKFEDNEKINNIITKYFNNFKYNKIIYDVSDTNTINLNNDYDINNIFLAKKLSITTELINIPNKIEKILDIFSKYILGKLIISENKFKNCMEKLDNIIVDITVEELEYDDLEFEDENIVDAIKRNINETKISYNEFIKNKNNAKKYGVTMYEQTEINLNNQIKEINYNLNIFSDLIEFPNLEYISSKKIRSLDINKRKTLKYRNRNISI